MIKSCRAFFLPPIQNPTPAPQRGFVPYLLIPFLQAFKPNLPRQITRAHNGVKTVTWKLLTPSWSGIEDGMHISQAEQTTYDFAIIFATIRQRRHRERIGQGMVSNPNLELLSQVEEVWEVLGVHSRILRSEGRSQ